MEKIKINLEKIVLSFLILSFFIGIWHAFPMLNVVNDEMYYVGGVFRALEHHKIIPLVNDVPYGTITYLSNYALILLTLPIYFIFSGFSLQNVKVFLIQRPEFSYLTLRFLSSILSLFLLYYIYKLLKKEIEDARSRLLVLVILFTNTITGIILHTGKMWVMSMLLVVVSFYYLYESINQKFLDDEKATNRNIFWSVFFSFLALSNFPLNFYSLINIPILLFYFRKDKDLLFKIISYVGVGVLVYLILTIINFEGIKNQILSIFTEYHPLGSNNINNLSFPGSLFVYLKKIIILFFPSLLLLALTVKKKIKNKRLFYISLVYLVLYVLVISFVANWTSDLKSSLRYLFPVGFFIIFLISSFDIKPKILAFCIGGYSLVNYIFLLYLLSVPTTYNNAYNWVNKNISKNDVVIFNSVPELQLIKNKESSVLTKNSFCSTKCLNIIESNLNSGFKPIVVDSLSNPYNNKSKISYYITEKPIPSNDTELITSFTNQSDHYHSVDYNLGSYFDLSFYKIKNLGKDIYIYKSK